MSVDFALAIRTKVNNLSNCIVEPSFDLSSQHEILFEEGNNLAMLRC